MTNFSLHTKTELFSSKLKFLILNKLTTDDMINLDVTPDDFYIMKRKEIINEHKEHRSIWFNPNNQKWCTKLGPEKKKVMRKKLEDLENDIVAYYIKINKHNYTVSEVFYMWCDYAINNETHKMKTINEYCCDYKRFIMNTSFSQKNIQQIKELDIVKFLKELVYSEEHISTKRFSSVKTIIRHIFNHAKIELEIDCICVKNIMNDINFPKSVFETKHISDDSQVFKKSEINKIKEHLKNTTNLEELGILLVCETGLRIGELATLKRTDIKQDILSIQRSEHKAAFPDGYKYFIGLPKCDIYRDVFLSNEAKGILNTITSLHCNEFLFPGENNEWDKSYNFDKAIRRVCKEIGIPERSMHKIRKTYASYLLFLGKPEKLVQQQLGHADIRTTQKAYHYNIFDDNETINEFKNISLGL